MPTKSTTPSRLAIVTLTVPTVSVLAVLRPLCVNSGAVYGNEKECGQGVARAIKDGLVKREDLFIVTKLWNYYHRKEHVEKLCKIQLDMWGASLTSSILWHPQIL